MHVPHGQRRNPREQLVAPGVEQVHPPAQAGDRARRAQASVVISAESRARSGLASGSRSNRSSTAASTSRSGPCPATIRSVSSTRSRSARRTPPWNASDHDRHSQRCPADCPRRHREQRGRGHRHRAQAQPGPGAPSRRRQGGQRVGPDARRHLVAEDREIFPKVEAGRQLPHGRLPLADRRGIGGAAQPGSQRLLAPRGPRAAQQLVERALAEDVEVVGVRMVRIEKARAAPPGTCPLAVEPRQPALVERTAVLGAAAAPADARVDGPERQKRRGRGDQPPPREPPEAGQRRDQQRDERHAEPGPGDRLLEPRGLRRAFPVSVNAAPILHSRSGLSLRHRRRASRASVRQRRGRCERIRVRGEIVSIVYSASGSGVPATAATKGGAGWETLA